MRRERGFDHVQLALVVVALGLLTAGAIAVRSYLMGVEERGYKRGKAEVEAAALLQQSMNEAAVVKALLAEQGKTNAAAALAAENERKWKEAKRAADRNGKPLVACAQPRPDIGSSSTTSAVAGEPPAEGARAPGVPAGDAGVRFLWRFVGLYDGAHLGIDGQPVFAASAEHAGAAARADTPSPYGPGKLLDVHGENAARHGDCLRKFDEAMRKIDAAAEAFDRANGRK